MENALLTEIDWDELMGDISDGNVIPVIGNEVYKFLQDGKLILFDNYLSESLLQQKNVGDISNLTLAEAVNYLRKKQNLQLNPYNSGFPSVSNASNVIRGSKG